MRHFSPILLFISILITANVEFIFTSNKNYTLTNKKHYFGLKLIVERKWMKIAYQENYCDEAL